jgi:hypothetical protein
MLEQPIPRRVGSNRLTRMRLNSACAYRHCWSLEAISSSSRSVDWSAHSGRKDRTISWIARAALLVCGTSWPSVA